ncbi:MAG: beta-lactamase family protein [Gammaproteobacteria bacterium]|nr:beta-lactamase family protein [Gammaproteobacteria bacterium]MBT8444137.1 beta-lactamase family protein [Gammaproteobacteria bacterium]
MMARFRVLLLIVILLAVGLLSLYFQDPWLWRRYTNTFLQLAGSEPRLLRPNELVSGDGSFQIPVAREDQRTITPLALRAAEEFAAGFESHTLIVIHKGRIQTEWYAEDWDTSSLTQSQSMHKSLLAILVGAAIEDGVIGSVDDPVARYIPQWEDDPRGDITLYELMMMSSGLAQYKFTLNPFTDDFRWLYSGDSQGAVLRTPLADWEPGTRFDYNNINSELLGTVLENATGKRYSELLEDYLWRPLGGDDARVWIDSEFGNAFTSCCLMATARDWARIGLLMLNRGRINDNRIVTAGWVDKMVTRSPVFKWYGLQTWLAYEKEVNPRSENEAAAGAYARSEPFLARDVYYFSGRGGQRVYVVPSRSLVVVRLGPALGPQPLKPGWDNAFLVNSLIRGMDELQKQKRDIARESLPKPPVNREADVPVDILEGEKSSVTADSAPAPEKVPANEPGYAVEPAADETTEDVREALPSYPPEDLTETDPLTPPAAP